MVIALVKNVPGKIVSSRPGGKPFAVNDRKSAEN